MDPTSFHKKHTGLYLTIVVLVLLLGAGIYYGNKTGMFSFSKLQPATDPNEIVWNDIHAITDKAVDTLSINLTDCIPNPAIAKFPLDATVVFSNPDAKEHSVEFSPTIKFKVAAKSQLSFTFDTWKLPGIRKYSCDGILDAGTVYATYVSK